MLKYAKLENSETKVLSVFLGTDINWAKTQGFFEMEVEQAYNGAYYLKGFTLEQPKQEQNQIEINTLKQYLTNTDYKIIKNFETGEEIPDDIKQKRMEARMRINELEGINLNE